MTTVSPPPSVRLWPARKRCYTCRQYFSFLVIRRLYCSYACAGLPEPDLSAKPRTCFNGKGKSYGRPKRVFFSAEEAMATEDAKADPTLRAYECPNCFLIHLGHEPLDWVKLGNEAAWRRFSATVRKREQKIATEVILGRRPPPQGGRIWAHAWWMQVG